MNKFCLLLAVCFSVFFYSQKKYVVVIHGGAGTILKKDMSPEFSPEEAFECSEERGFIPSQDLKNTTEEEVYQAIQGCNSIQELLGLYKAFPQFQNSLKVDFEAKKSLIMNLTNPNNFSQNGKSRFQ
jgi:hypothetical protein